MMGRIHFSLSFWAGMTVLLFLVLIETGCSGLGSKPVSRPLPDVAAPDLLLDVKSFPENWEVGPETNRGLQYGHAMRSFVRPPVPGHVLQDVYNFGNVETAKSQYQLYRKADFAKSPPPQVPSTDLVPPHEITYRSPMTDEYYLGCGWDTIYICRALFRYGQYVVEFYFNIDNGDETGLKFQEVEPVLRAMDEKASSVLGIPLTRPTP